eukprot:TRINITY_DN87_c0_g1_i2.p3 TRINITY_DN87_c0_g1~~TRINITY_DN87_c0_g1_i2.p3  ORF type:complete len:119 (-),score=4.62 TRINITY_DN87_c0_g1_i2:29-385(-)
MVLDLEVKICHPPVDKRGVTHVHRMVRSVGNPVHMNVLGNHGKVSVGNSKVGENIGGSNPHVHEITNHSPAPSKMNLVYVSDDRVSQSYPSSLDPLFLAKNTSWVEEHGPARGHEEAG